jgi:hypothetical protein
VRVAGDFDDAALRRQVNAVVTAERVRLEIASKAREELTLGSLAVGAVANVITFRLMCSRSSTFDQGY